MEGDTACQGFSGLSQHGRGELCFCHERVRSASRRKAAIRAAIAFGGPHRFMSWGKPVLTDSGGFQVASLSALRQVSDEGVLFRSHLDGSLHSLTPERAVEIQEKLGSDVAMVLDGCLLYPSDRA